MAEYTQETDTTINFDLDSINEYTQETDTTINFELKEVVALGAVFKTLNGVIQTSNGVIQTVQ